MRHKILPILLLAAVLRLGFLAHHDLADDEAHIAMRSASLFDYMEIYTFLTPVQTFESEQWWQKFSFHDFPPLGFWIEHTSIRIFGENPWGVRIPAALAGVGTVYLVYLIGRRLFDKRFGLFSALVMSVLNYHLWASRVGFLESLEIFFMLLALWFFLKTFDNQKWWMAVGATTGAALLTKYFAIILLPFIFLLVLIFERRAFRSLWLYLGILLGILTLTPTIIYNYNLYQAKSYFDAGLSSMLGMVPDVYKETLGNRVPGHFGLGVFRLVHSGSSWIEIFLALAGLVLFAIETIKDREHRLGYWLVGGYTLVTFGLFAFIPLQKQYVALTTLSFAWLSGYGFYYLRNLENRRLKKRLIAIAGVLFVAAAMISINTQFFTKPLGKENLSFLTLRPNFYNYKYLEQWLREFYKTHFYRFSFYEEPQIRAYQKEIFDNHQDWQLAPSSERELLVYDSTFDFAAVRWMFLRRKLKELRPIIISENFLRDLKEQPEFRQSLQNKFDVFYFVFLAPELAGEEIIWRKGIDQSSREILLILSKLNQNPSEIISNRQGEGVFWVFKVPAASFMLAF